MCHQTGVSPDALIANKFLRKAVNNFHNGTSHTKGLHKQIQQQPQPPLPPSPPPLMAVPPPAPFRSKSPYSASSYSRSSHTYSQSRSHSPSFSQSPPCPRRGKKKSHSFRSRSRSPGYHHSRSRSPPYRRYNSRSRSPVFRGQSPTKWTVPQGDGERQHFNRYREVPAYDMKASYGRFADFGDPFEMERYGERDRNYREWHEMFYKGHAVGTKPREEKTKKDDPKETKSVKLSKKEHKSTKPVGKSKASDAKPEKRKRKVDKEVDEHEASSIKAFKPETAESKTSPKGKTESGGEKGKRPPEKDKSAFLNNPTKKTELNQETGKKIVSGK
ncbi:e3 ubiquitin-protein ligase rbbp6 isoform x6 [Limosa lapponica baueri]|uniref:E3 ubiquitin-protein ligase rbbp6 isoform x6 n=1 Tax=Limosa lapponica baueri TaxID=1758121 RepID=A0A2I0TH83_LIMLA|nr:e3 ubiquitin-protein ligase rbbp6 isoform x6 [Limosa lapponica baueri]